jgi:hypothetical protein
MVFCRCCGNQVSNVDHYPIHTACIAKHWAKHKNGANVSRCAEFGPAGNAANRRMGDAGHYLELVTR